MPQTSSVKALMTRVKKEKVQLQKAQDLLLGDPTEKEMKKPASKYYRGPFKSKETRAEEKAVRSAATAHAKKQKEARTVVENMMADIMKKLSIEIDNVEKKKAKAAVPEGGYKRATLKRRGVKTK